MTDDQLDRLTEAARSDHDGFFTVDQLALLCERGRERAERRQYQALSDYQREAYDYLRQRGSTHSDCMAAAGRRLRVPPRV
jgi:hypothetical protein